MDYSELVALARSKTGYVEPVSGGDEAISDDEVIEYLNDAFTLMTKKIGGLEKYVQFTITAAGVIAVTVPASGGPTVAAVSPQKLSFPSYSISDAYQIVQIENLTDGMIDRVDRVLYRIGALQREYASTFEDSDQYYRWVDGQARRGFVLLPKTITGTNTIAVTYGGKFTRYSLGTISQTTGTGVDDVSLSGTYTKTDGSTTSYAIKISTAAAQDKFKVSVDGGATYGDTEYNCAVAGVSIGNGLTITCGAITDHTLDDVWSWTAVAPDLDYFDDDEHRGFPAEYAAGMTLADLQQLEADGRLGKAWGMLRDFLYNREGESMVEYHSIVD